jgi:competence protein ComEA
VAAALIAASLLAMAGWWLWQAQLRGRLIDIEVAEPIAIEFKIDVNRADWPELALMPNIGEQLAKRIVADRSERGPYRDLAELRRVRGIGPKTLESMRPYLLPLPDLDTTADAPSEPRERAPAN